MLLIDAAWQGTVQLPELLFGSWLVYFFLVLLWERLLRQPLEEWRYASLVLLGAGFYFVNRYFQHAPFYSWIMNGLTLVLWIGWYRIGVRGRGSLLWSLAATLGFWAFTAAFVGFEQAGRFLVQRSGLHEFWFMLVNYTGFAALIWWRSLAGERRPGPKA